MRTGVRERVMTPVLVVVLALVMALPAPGGAADPGVTVSALSPAAGTVAVTATADLPVPLRKLKIKIDGVVVRACTASPCVHQWDTSAVGNGAHALRAVAVDRQGAVHRSRRLTVHVDNAPPGGGPTLEGCRVFPPDNPWNTDISGWPAHPDSDTYLASIGAGRLHPDFGDIYGIPFATVPGTQPLVPVSFSYDDESDPGPYPIPPDAPVEPGSDRHVLVLDRDRCLLYEMYDAERDGTGWSAGSGAIWDLTINDTRPPRWTSADAAGLPILPGLVRYDEVVEKGEIAHALRFTVPRTRRAYIAPASHWASTSDDPRLPPMGLRLRLRADFDETGFHPHVQVILRALKRYGMMVADNGSRWYITGALDPRWDNEILDELKTVDSIHFEVVDTGPIVTP
jgi:hypothetical protein